MISKYMFVLILSVAIPFILSFIPMLKIWRNIPALAVSIFLIVIIFGGWDVFATSRGHWSFNSQDVWPIRIINLPLEEVLFFVVIPFCCIFTWEAVNLFKGRLK